jgi:hypothetical protein
VRLRPGFRERQLRERRRKDAIGVALIVAQLLFLAGYVTLCVHLDHARGISVAEDLATVGL